jgi:hypothetical protein
MEICAHIGTLFFVGVVVSVIAFSVALLQRKA